MNAVPGVSGRTISRWETGKNMPDISILVEIAEDIEQHNRPALMFDQFQNGYYATGAKAGQAWI